jgi:ATP-dependent Clp protease ATP-binding subunit ClpC
MKLMASGLAKHSSFLFVGPTGVGKTQIAKILGEKFSGNFFKVNCAEYAHAHEYAKLIGSPPGFIGHSEKSLLAEKAEKSNRWVFLFDEIEKAHHKLYDFLLSLLDDGTCTDNMGKVLDFSQSIFIFTSNQGISEINREPMGFDRKKTDAKVCNDVLRKSVKRHFSPEFLNRIDDIVVFNSLKKDEIRKIAKLQLDGLPIKQTDPLIDFIVEGGYSEEYGARNIARFIKNNVSSKLAEAILGGYHIPIADNGMYTPKIVNGEVKIEDCRKNNSTSL